MFPGLMAVKFNLFSLPVLEGDGEQGLLQSRCPKPLLERGQGFSRCILSRVMREQGFVAIRSGRDGAVLPVSTAPSVPACPWGAQASPGIPGTPPGHPQATQCPPILSAWIFPDHPQPRAGLPPSSRN